LKLNILSCLTQTKNFNVLICSWYYYCYKLITLVVDAVPLKLEKKYLKSIKINKYDSNSEDDYLNIILFLIISFKNMVLS